MVFRKMQRSIYDAGRGLSTQTDALADLGLRFVIGTDPNGIKIRGMVQLPFALGYGVRV